MHLHPAHKADFHLVLNKILKDRPIYLLAVTDNF